jgi:hypothetical protein
LGHHLGGEVLETRRIEMSHPEPPLIVLKLSRCASP